MPRAGDDMFYSFDMGPVHFVSVSSEYYYYLNYGIKMVGNQFKWLENDLKVRPVSSVISVNTFLPLGWNLIQ